MLQLTENGINPLLWHPVSFINAFLVAKRRRGVSRWGAVSQQNNIPSYTNSQWHPDVEIHI
jgi:hypothetical protein